MGLPHFVLYTSRMSDSSLNNVSSIGSTVKIKIMAHPCLFPCIIDKSFRCNN